MGTIWRLLTGCVLALIWLGGWWLCDIGVVPLKTLNPPSMASYAVIPDTVKSWSPGQSHRLQDPNPSMYPYFADESFVPPDVSFVRVEFLADIVEKPYTPLYVTGRVIPLNDSRFEYGVAVREALARELVIDMDYLSCTARSADMEARDDLLEIRGRAPGLNMRRCLISRHEGCRYLWRLQWRLRLSADVPRPMMEELRDLRVRMACPSWMAIAI